MKANVKKDPNGFEKQLRQKLQEQATLGFAQGMKAEAQIILSKINDSSLTATECIAEIRKHLEWVGATAEDVAKPQEAV